MGEGKLCRGVERHFSVDTNVNLTITIIFSAREIRNSLNSGSNETMLCAFFGGDREVGGSREEQ